MVAELRALIQEHWADFRLPLLLTATAMFALLLGGEHTPNSRHDMHFVWTFAAHFSIPMVTIVLLDIRRKGWALALALLGAALALTPLVLRIFYADQGWWNARAWPLFVEQLAALSVLLAAAGLGGAKLSDWGLGLGDWRWWGPKACLALLAVLAVVGVGSALSPELLEYYPQRGKNDLGVMLLYQAKLGIYMVGWEFFFRGFLLFGITRTSGAKVALLVQALPFFLLHTGKPELEMVSSFFGAILLGIFCLRSRSFWPAVLLHWFLNFAMSVLGFIF